MDKSDISIHASDNSLSEFIILLISMEKHDLIYLQIDYATTTKKNPIILFQSFCFQDCYFMLFIDYRHVKRVDLEIYLTK